MMNGDNEFGVSSLSPTVIAFLLVLLVVLEIVSARVHSFASPVPIEKPTQTGCDG